MDGSLWEMEAAPLAAFLLSVLMLLSLPAIKTKASEMPDSFSKQDLLFNLVYKCVHVAGQRTMCEVAKAMYARKLKSTKGTIPVGDHCKQTGITIPKSVNESLLGCDIMIKEFDISFAYFLMKTVCSSLYKKLDCQLQVDTLRLLRNKINHKYGKFEESLESFAAELKATIRKIYEGVGTVVQDSFEDNITSVEKILDEIFSAKFQVGATATTDDKTVFENDKRFIMINGGKAELQGYYSNLKILNPFIILMEEDTHFKEFKIDKIFTPLEIVDSKGEINMKHLLTETKTVKGEKKVPAALFLCGQAGSGKTSLCQYLLHQWQEGGSEVDNLCSFDLIIHVEARKFCSKSVLHYLCEYLMPETCKKLKKEDIIPLLQELDILFIIDGCEEKNISDLLTEIFRDFGDKRMIITTRSVHMCGSTKLARNADIDYLSIKVCGFDDIRLKEFSKNVFKLYKEENKYKNFSEYIDGPGKVLDTHLRLPLTTALLIILWLNNSEIVNTVTTATRLYEELFTLCQERLAQRLCVRYRRPYNDMFAVLKKLMLTLGEHAWNMLEKELYILEDNILNDISEVCAQKKVDPKDFLSAFLMSEDNNFKKSDKGNQVLMSKDKKSERGKPIYEFLHKTQMEYLAAAFLTNSLNNKNQKENRSLRDIANLHKCWKNYQEVIKYLTGHMASQEILQRNERELIDLIDKAEVKNTDFNFWWNIVAESHPIIRRQDKTSYDTVNHPEVKRIITKEKLQKENWILDDTNVVSGLKLLKCTRVFLRSLQIKISRNPHKIPFFLEEMQGVGEHRKYRVKLYLFSRDQTSDIFLDSVMSWSILEHFEGSLQEQHNFSGCNELKNICVTVTTLEALQSLCDMPKCVRTLRVTLKLPPECNPADVPYLNYSGNLEVNLVDLTNERMPWVLEVLKKMVDSDGCWRLSLQFYEVTFKDIRLLVKKLKYIVADKLSIKCRDMPDMEDQEALQSNTRFRINWIS